MTTDDRRPADDPAIEAAGAQDGAPREDMRPTGRNAAKSGAAFRTISEASEELDVPQHVLRFWETKFSQVRPLKRGGKRRYYRPEDIALLTNIRDLLYDKGYTIKGVQRLLKEGAVSRKLSADDAVAADQVEAMIDGLLPPSEGALSDDDLGPLGDDADDLPLARDSLPVGGQAVGRPTARYSPFSRADILAAQDSPDAILFSPSRAALLTAVNQLRALRAELEVLAARPLPSGAPG